jgi:mRNA-degrading endonuclease RelE of RelBE toxin-antitoxin system
MAFDIEFTQTAADQVRGYREFEQKVIIETVGEQLTYEPNVETRNRKRLGENELSDWELRVQKFRVFYDILTQEDRQIVKIKAVGHKEQNKLFVGGKEVQL